MAPTSTRRKRPHPAGGARRLAGWLSVAAMTGLTGGMVVASRIATTTSATATRAATSAVATTSSDDDYSTSQRAVTAQAVAGNASSQPVTVSRAS